MFPVNYGGSAFNIFRTASLLPLIALTCEALI
jgi:hypothetical protein